MNAREETPRTSIVDSLLEAAGRLMPDLGYAKTTTNRLADRAGVSIGSFYQYFKSKDALFTRLMDEVSTRYLKQLEGLEARCAALPQREATALFIGEIVDFNFDHRLLLRELFSLAPKYGRLETVYNLRNDVARALAQAAARRGPVGADEELKHFITSNAVCGVIDNVLFSTNGTFDREHVKRELVELVTRYRA